MDQNVAQQCRAVVEKATCKPCMYKQEHGLQSAQDQSFWSSQHWCDLSWIILYSLMEAFKKD